MITKYFQLIFVWFSVTLGFSQINFDENQVPDYILPDILLSQNGEKIETSGQWDSIRRPEILDMFKNYVYGNVCDDDIKIKFETTDIDDSALCGKAIRKNVAIHFINGTDTLTANLLIYIPLKHLDEPVPLFLGMNFFGNHTIYYDLSIPISDSYVRNNPGFNIFNNKGTEESRGVRESRWPVERIIDRGYGIATIYYGDIDPDFDDGFKNGLHKLTVNCASKNPDKRSSISAWAYALSRAIDYFETDDDINQNQIIVFGHSRLGKVALWAGAVDKRFAIVISNDSGCGGAALSRRKFGETVKQINESFPHWFCKAFKDFNDKEDSLPLDQHMLIGLIAPRPVYVASAENDKWADPKGEYLSLFYSGPVYRLYGLQTFEQDSLPIINKPLWIGNMGYHIRSGYHDITRFDWERYLDFADNQFNKIK